MPAPISPGPSPFEVPPVPPGQLHWAQSCQELLSFAQNDIWKRLVQRGVYLTHPFQSDAGGQEEPPPFHELFKFIRRSYRSDRLVGNQAFVAAVARNTVWVWDLSRQTQYTLDLGANTPKNKPIALALHDSTLWVLAPAKSSAVPAPERPLNWQAQRHERELTAIQEWNLGSANAAEHIATTYLPGQSYGLIANEDGAHLALTHELGQIDERHAKEFLGSPSLGSPNVAIRQAIESNRAMLQALGPASLAPYFYQTRHHAPSHQGALLGCESIARMPGRLSSPILKLQVPPAKQGSPQAAFGLIDPGAWLRHDKGWLVTEGQTPSVVRSVTQAHFIRSATQTHHIELPHVRQTSAGLYKHQEDIYLLDRYYKDKLGNAKNPTHRLTLLKLEEDRLSIRTSIDLPGWSQLGPARASAPGLLTESSAPDRTPLNRVRKVEQDRLEALSPFYLPNHPGWGYRPLESNLIFGTGIVTSSGEFARWFSVQNWVTDINMDPAPSKMLPKQGHWRSKISLKHSLFLPEASILVLPYHDSLPLDLLHRRYGLWLISINDQGVIGEIRDLPLPTTLTPSPPQGTSALNFDLDPTQGILSSGSLVVIKLSDRILWIDPVNATVVRNVPTFN